MDIPPGRHSETCAILWNPAPAWCTLRWKEICGFCGFRVRLDTNCFETNKPYYKQLNIIQDEHIGFKHSSHRIHGIHGMIHWWQYNEQKKPQNLSQASLRRLARWRQNNGEKEYWAIRVKQMNGHPARQAQWNMCHSVESSASVMYSQMKGNLWILWIPCEIRHK